MCDAKQERINYRSSEVHDRVGALVRMRRVSRRLLGEQSGQSLIDFTVAAVTTLLVIFAVFEFSMVAYAYAVLGDAAREGVRYAVVHGTSSGTCSGPSAGCGDSTGANVTTVVKQYAAYSFHDASNITVTPTWPDSSSAPGSRVKVNLSYSYIPFVTIPGGVTPTMTLSSEGRIVF